MIQEHGLSSSGKNTCKGPSVDSIGTGGTRLEPSARNADIDVSVQGIAMQFERNRTDVQRT